MEKLDDFKKSQLREVVNIGVGNASTALSHLFGSTVSIGAPEVVIDTIDNISEKIAGDSDVVAANTLKITGDLSGVILIMFPDTCALKIIESLTQSSADNLLNITDLEKSALKEVGNIITGASLSSLANFLGLKIVQSIPDTIIDMPISIIDSLLTEIREGDDDFLFVNIFIEIADKDIRGDVHFIFDSETTRKIIEATDKLIGA